MVEITDDDDMIDYTRWMRKHADEHIRDLMQGHDEMDFLLHDDDDNNVAGNFTERRDPKSIVRKRGNHRLHQYRFGTDF